MAAGWSPATEEAARISTIVRTGFGGSDVSGRQGRQAASQGQQERIGQRTGSPAGCAAASPGQGPQQEEQSSQGSSGQSHASASVTQASSPGGHAAPERQRTQAMAATGWARSWRATTSRSSTMTS
jgi:hypothetical protein